MFEMNFSDQEMRLIAIALEFTKSTAIAGRIEMNAEMFGEFSRLGQVFEKALNIPSNLQ